MDEGLYIILMIILFFWIRKLDNQVDELRQILSKVTQIQMGFAVWPDELKQAIKDKMNNGS